MPLQLGDGTDPEGNSSLFPVDTRGSATSCVNDRGGGVHPFQKRVSQMQEDQHRGKTWKGGPRMNVRWVTSASVMMGIRASGIEGTSKQPSLWGSGLLAGRIAIKPKSCGSRKGQRVVARACGGKQKGAALSPGVRPGTGSQPRPPQHTHRQRGISLGPAGGPGAGKRDWLEEKVPTKKVLAGHHPEGLNRA